jgi:putative ABC transport system permease protein
LDNFFKRQSYDTTIQFRQNQRADLAINIAQSMTGVEKAEVAFVQSASMFVKGQLVKEAGIGTSIRGIPDGSDFYKPLMTTGRWFLPGDGRAVVVSRDAAEKNKISIGDVVTLDLGELGKDEWQVIGFYEPVFVGSFNADTIYAPLSTLYRTTKKHNEGSIIFIRTTNHDKEFTSLLTKRLKDLYEGQNMKVLDSQTQAELRSTNEWQFSIVTTMLVALSIIIATVGGIALMGALSIGVIERTKEIGVLRAVGARSHTIMGIFVMEGVLQGMLSWLISIPISLIASPSVASLLGHAMFGATLDYRYNWVAVFTWLLLVVVISVVASILPARGATRISVRDSLAYA